MPRRTLDLILSAHTAGWKEQRSELRVTRSVAMLHDLYAAHGIAAEEGAFSYMLHLARDVSHLELATQLHGRKPQTWPQHHGQSATANGAAPAPRPRPSPWRWL